MAKAKQVHCMTMNEDKNLAISFSSLLGTGQVLTGTPTITASPSTITISNKVVSIAELTLNSETVPIGGAVQCHVADPTATGTYTITILCSDDESPAQTHEGEIILTVE